MENSEQKTGSVDDGRVRGDEKRLTHTCVPPCRGAVSARAPRLQDTRFSQDTLQQLRQLSRLHEAPGLSKLLWKAVGHVRYGCDQRDG